MRGDQIVFLGAAFILILGISLAAQFRWLGGGKVQRVVVFIAGVGSIAALWLAGLPPAWFAGQKTGFGIALSLGAGAFLGRTAEEKAFAFPFLFGMGLTLLVANVVAVIT